MTAFADLAKRKSIGIYWYFLVSVDDGATFTLSYSTQWGFAPVGGFLESQPRILSLGNISRSLGADYGFVSASIDVTLDNTDGLIDWLVDREQYASTAINSIWELNCHLYDPQDPTDYDTKTLGRFQFLDPPTRNNQTVQFTLADGSIGKISDLAVSPSVRDWCAITDANRPAFLTTANLGANILSTVPGVNYDAPIPIAWGSNLFKLERTFGMCYVICAVPAASSSLTTTVSSVRLGNLEYLPQRLSRLNLSTGLPVSSTIWTIRRTPTITKNGKDWHLLWLELDLCDNDDPANPYPDSGTGGLSATAKAYLSNWYDFKGVRTVEGFDYYDLIGPIYVEGSLLSHTVDDLPLPRNITAAAVVDDIVTECLPTALTITGLSDVLASRPHDYASGRIVQGIQTDTINGSNYLELSSGDAATALRKLCSVGRFDLFFNWAGDLQIACPANDYTAQTATLAAIEDDDTGDVSERIASVGQRHAVANKAVITFDGRRFGPVLNQDSIDELGRTISKEIDGSWLPDIESFNNSGPRRTKVNSPDLSRFQLDSTIRPVVSVALGINGLNFELGNFVEFTWLRGSIGGPYSSAVFRVEGISLSPLDGKTQLELVWFDDLRGGSNGPYILDNETLNIRISASGGRTVTLVNTSTTVTFSSGNLTSDGVVAGDILKVIDATESAQAFYRNRTLRIISIDSATTATVEASDFSTGGPFVLTDWTIYRGQSTTARASYYGKTCTVLGTYYNATVVYTRLLDG